MYSQEFIITNVALQTQWMVKQRLEKLREGLHDTMSISPFLIPIIFDLHHANNFSDLAQLLISGHLMIGHFTSFGKFIDEKILPNIFGTFKLSSKYRAANYPLNIPCFNEIDHIVQRANTTSLLSLKASKWTINLSVAKELNTAFSIILRDYKESYNEIIVGIFNGNNEGLTDKYDIIKGINRGKFHDVADIRANIRVLAGQSFWSWLNYDEAQTQNWVLAGILEGLNQADCRDEAEVLLQSYVNLFNQKYNRYIQNDGIVNWQQLLLDING